MSQRRERGEALALVLKALREHPRGLSGKEIAWHTGIELGLCSVLLSNYRSVGHVESRGVRPYMRWYLADASPSDEPPQLVTPMPARSIFAPSSPSVSPSFALATSRVMREQEGCVQSSDFSEGAFMADWRRRTGGGDAPTR
jgi:hypothetical protein